MAEIKEAERKNKIDLLPNTARLQENIPTRGTYTEMVLAPLPTQPSLKQLEGSIACHGRAGNIETVYMRDIERANDANYRISGNTIKNLSNKKVKVAVGQVRQATFSGMENANRANYKAVGDGNKNLENYRATGLANNLKYSTFNGMEVKNTKKQFKVKK